LAVTWQLLAELKPADLRMEDVVAAGINKASLYRHFANREALLEALSLDGAEAARRAIESRVPPEADAVTKLRIAVDVFFEMRQKVLLSLEPEKIAARTSPQSDPGAVHPMVHVGDRVRSIIEQSVREGSFDVPHSGFAAVTVFHMINPHLLSRDRVVLGLDDDELHSLVIATLLKAFSNRRASFVD
jgi:AcrR family transcriptional regulator